jgi:opacity protein-like surface antigen
MTRTTQVRTLDVPSECPVVSPSTKARGKGIARFRSRAALCLAFASCATVGCAQESSPDKAPPGTTTVWANDVGDGFRKGARQAGLSGAVGVGTAVLGSKEEHDVALLGGRYGWALTEVLGNDHWYRGNLLVLGEVFAGAQFNPNDRYLAGITALLRYAFATASRWVPFVDAGAGISFTNIKEPDLSGTFQFNVQVGAGVHYFLRDDFAVTLGYRWLHLSNAGIERPNHGVNTQVISLGVDWFF